MTSKKGFLTWHIVIVLLTICSLRGIAQEQPVAEVSVLESRFSTTAPTVGKPFTYSLKFDHQEGIRVSPVEHFAEHGIAVIERKRLDPQSIQGRVSEQYEYTLMAQQAGDYEFIPASIQYAGPRQNPIAAQPELTKISVKAGVEAQIVTNSPIMLNETLELSLAVTKRAPATVTLLPQTIAAALQMPEEPAAAEQEASSSPTPTSPSKPLTLRFDLDQTQTITPQQNEGQTVESYKYILAAAPDQAGEYVIPELTVSYRSETGEEIQIRTKEVSIFVLNPNTGNLDAPTDYRFLILPAIVLGAMVLAGLIVLLYLKYWRPRRREAIIAAPALPPGELAHQELARIRALRLPAKGEFKAYYTMVSESVRKFLGAEFGFHVLERTTEEVLHDIQQRDVPEPVKARTGQFLWDADLVKFAKYIPTFEEAESAMEQAVQIVDESVEYHRPNIAIQEEHAPNL